MVLNAQKHAPGSTTVDTPSCPTSCGASVPLVVFAFILSLVGLILCSTASVVFWTVQFAGGSLGLPSNGPGLACAVIAMLLAFVSMILDSAARCACCSKRATPAMLGGGTTIIIQNAAAPQQQSYARPGAPSAYSVSPAQKLAPGWTQAGPDGAFNAHHAAPARCARNCDLNDPNTPTLARPSTLNHQRPAACGTSAPTASRRGRRRTCEGAARAG